MADRALTIMNGNVIVPTGFNESLDLIRRTFAKDLTDDELSLYLATANSLGMSIIRKQVHAVKRKNKSGPDIVTFQIGIDGYRSTAEHHPDYAGQDGPYWCGHDGRWVDVWLEADPPRAAKVGVYRKGFQAPLYAVALWDEYVQDYWDKDARKRAPTAMWKKMPALMLAKCAEGLAIRKAFPAKLGGTYTDAEMAQADRENAIEATARVVDTTTGEITPITADAWERASKRLHATARDNGITHDDLHAWAVDKKFGSVKDVPTGALNAMADSIRDRPEDAKKYFSKWRSEQDETTSPDPIEAEHRPINTGPITDDEVDAAINTATPGSLPLDMVDGGDPDRFAR